ncbi:choice-of-anchor I family protein [Polaribacter sp. BAL334]|uniref:choice-of-anchor I family protein n=1 Tax=Polaribacter sp. BAL334 TaxID=1708178 RepID=UPI0018D2651E|nr:choice-of-anchor I family protein [Polaribacter sp. BAL334]MBG7611545.1 choice-of-anchor I family protein [Polaribacter sp. BAL334]
MKIKFTLFFCLLSYLMQAQLSTAGDIAFVGFNADGDDDIAFVTFKDIPANSTILFCDSEWNGTSFGTDEGDFTWTSGATVIPAGTVITINSLSATITPSVGSITVNNAGGLSSSSDAMFAFLGTSPRTVSTMLAAISNSSTGFGDLTNSGLTLGTTAIVLTEGTDIANYNGVRTGLDANGYLSQLNNPTNWQVEDTSADDHNNSTTPDLPFNATPFVISANDTSAPTVAIVNVLTQNTVEVIFSESLDQVSAETITNYVFAPSLTITNAAYNATLNSVTLTHSGFTEGTAYQLTVSNIKDTANNFLTSSYVSPNLFYNVLTSGLIISEIMYNAPSANSNQLEFIEIYNNTTSSIALGGIKVKDESNFTFEFEELNIAAGGIVLLATDKTSADAFYGVSFIDLPQGISNALGNGGENIQILNSTGAIISQVTYDDAAPWPTSPDGNGPSLELLNPNGNLNDGTNWAPATNLVGQSIGLDVFASPGTFTPIIASNITFASETTIVNENDGTATINLKLSNAAASIVTVDVSVMLNTGTATNGSQFSYNNETVTFQIGETSKDVLITLNNDAIAQGDSYFALTISNPSGANIQGISENLIYILDDEKEVKTASNALDISFLSSYLVDATGSAEIVAHDPVTQRLFVMNSTASKVEILNFSNPSAITSITSVDLSSYGIGGTSIAFKNGILAATVEGADYANGKVVFMDASGNIGSVVEAGVLPDMIAFTPDGTKVLTANEGQPNGDYTIDPEGSISIINVSGGFNNVQQTDVTTLNFNAFDSEIATLKANGLRVFGINPTVSKDVEPEFITVADDGLTAWVTLQENNAVATINLTTNQISAITPLGLKDHNVAGNSLDASDQFSEIFMANWPVKGMYMPDAIANYTIAGTTYLVTANEGDARDYNALEEEVRVGSSAYVLDPTTFPNAALLKKNSNLGRLTVTNATGDTDNDGDFDEIHVFGTRSFSIWNANTGQLVYDSGDDFEKITANDPTFGVLFNVSNDNNNLKNRSDNKGPEPEGITVATINGATYAFITLERTGGMMTYDITNPSSPVFVSYKNSRTTNTVGGDLAPEGIIYIAPSESPVSKGLVIMANEVSATLSIYQIANDVLSTENFENNVTPFTVYPNPVKDGMIYFDKEVSVSLFDITGKKLIEKHHTTSLEINYPSGIYILKTNDGMVKKVIKQ